MANRKDLKFPLFVYLISRYVGQSSGDVTDGCLPARSVNLNVIGAF